MLWGRRRRRRRRRRSRRSRRRRRRRRRERGESAKYNTRKRQKKSPPLKKPGSNRKKTIESKRGKGATKGDGTQDIVLVDAGKARGGSGSRGNNANRTEGMGGGKGG